MAILGIDEVGRGPLAGPLVIGAVILPEEKPKWVNLLRDSKKLTAKKRKELNEIILKEAPASSLGFVSNFEIDELGITEALKLATRRAVRKIQAKQVPFSQIIIDGKINFLAGTALEKYVSTVVKADDLIKEVSAASIIAKVARDSYMMRVAEKFPEYGFSKNVGYGTKEHMIAIEKNGICLEHRRSFEPIKSMVGFSREYEQKKNTTRLGQAGESKVIEYLVDNGHSIVAHDFKTKKYEIDIISILGNQIYFTEVKYRKNGVFGGGLSAITKEKRRQMKFGAESFLVLKREFSRYDPLLAVADVSGEDFSELEWFCLDE